MDKQRVLWKNSNQEVIRLKALLQAAEESEQQHRTQLTNAQEQTQKLKTKMQTVEKVIRILQGGIAVNRYFFLSFQSLLLNAVCFEILLDTYVFSRKGFF